MKIIMGIVTFITICAALLGFYLTIMGLWNGYIEIAARGVETYLIYRVKAPKVFYTVVSIFFMGSLFLTWMVYLFIRKEK
jgi:hypothetical protein